LAKQVNSSGAIIKKMEFSRNDLRVLAAIRDCGLISIKQLASLFPHRKLSTKPHLARVYNHTYRLINMGFVQFHKRFLQGKTGLLSVTPEGHAMLRVHSCGLGVNADALADAAGIRHFVSMTDVMLKFHQEFDVSFWLTDCMVRAENNARGDEGFAKDWDAVGRIAFEGKPLTVAVEYEHVLKSRSRYRDVFKSYSADPYVQLVIFIVRSARWSAPITESMSIPGRRLCFVSGAQFFTQPFKSMPVVRWNGQSVDTVSMAQAMKQATENKSREYLVSFNPPE
jgi:hypothetical protein